MTVIIDGTSGINTPGVVNTAAQTIATTLAVTGVTTIAAGSAAAPALVGATGGATTGVWFPAASTVAFANAGVESARIDASGNLLVGTTSATTNKLDVQSAVNVDLIRMKQTDASNFNNSVQQLGGSRNTTNGTWRFLTCVNFGASADKLIIYDSGNVVNANNSYGAISDIKLKENIVDATPKLDKLNQVRVVNYNLIGDEQKQIGVIAQELEQVFPSLVEATIDRDAEGNDLGTTTKGVKYSVFVPMLIKAIQEQQAIITALTTRITALEAK
jgi:hypothetical protein